MDLSEEEKELYKKMGNNLATIRGSQSQEKIASIIGMKASNYNTIEAKKGERHLKDFQLIKLAKHYNTSTDYLLGLTNIETPDITTKTICNEYGLTEESLKNIYKINYEEKKVMGGILEEKYGISKINTINKVLENYKLIEILESYFYSNINENYLLGFLGHGEIALYDKRKKERKSGHTFIDGELIENGLMVALQNELIKIKEQIKKEGEKK